MTAEPRQTITISQASKILQEADNIAILTHANPDGDTVGSAVALCLILRHMGKRAFVRCNSTSTDRYTPYLDGFTSDEPISDHFVVAVDIADPTLLTPEDSELNDKVDLCIDHHPSNRMFAHSTFLDPQSPACGILVYRLMRHLEVPLTRKLALPLYLAVSTDTGCFRYSGTTPETLRIAADLIETGINFFEINEKFFNTLSPARLALENHIYTTAQYYEKNSIAFAHVSLKLMNDLNLHIDDVDNISSYLRSIDGVEAGAFFREKSKNVWKISLRTSAAYNASNICATLGGGGHMRAAGCTFEGTVSEAYEALLSSIKAEGSQ